MSQDRKTEASPMPGARPNDPEDVAWALSTAEAMWNGGDREGALKWIRRAAEAASDADLDDRALELAKAASALAPKLASVPPPPVPAPPRPARQSLPAIAPALSASPPRPGRPSGSAQTRPIMAKVTPPPPKVGSDRPAPSAPRLAKLPPAPPSRPGDLHRGGDPEVTREVQVPTANRPHGSGRPPAPKPEPNPSRRITDSVPPPPVTTPAEDWPTESHSSHDFSEPHEERTRIGSADYSEGARLAMARAQLEETAARGVVEIAERESIPHVMSTQAVRVVVYRSDGAVMVAPHGTRLGNVPHVQAVLVSLEPHADLATWLIPKP
jgi:hypothetical protein